MWIYIDGKLVSEKKAVISVFDHGFLYGDGVFEGIRSYSGCVFKLDQHLKRLYASARAIRLTIPLSFNEIKEAVLETLRKNHLKDAYIRLVVSRGKGDLGLDPDKCPKPTVIIITDKIVLYPNSFYEKGMAIATVPTRRNIPEALNPRIKSLNYLNNILAKIEAKQMGVLEALMLNADGYVAECTGDNIFIVRDGELITPPPESGILKGITREFVIKIASLESIRFEERTLTRFDIYTADECFLTGTAAEIIPITMIDQRIIGDGKVGSITRRLINIFKKRVTTEGTQVYK